MCYHNKVGRSSSYRRIKGSYTFDCIAGTICSIISLMWSKLSVQLQNTDSASNFKKTFVFYVSCKESKWFDGFDFENHFSCDSDVK